MSDGLLAVVLAPCCAACRAPLEEPTLGPVCRACWDRVNPIVPPVCDRCGDPLPSWRTISVAASICPRCRRGSGSIRRGRAVGCYDGSLREILHAFKYDGRRSLARPLGIRLREAGAEILEGVDVAVPVPLHRVKERRRGYNQAADLAANLGLPVCHALRRVRNTPSQTDLPAARRHANVRDAFSVRKRAHIAGRRIVLVDDVSTTGATLESCARVLLAAGAAEVRALTVARVVSRRP